MMPFLRDPAGAASAKDGNWLATVREQLDAMALPRDQRAAASQFLGGLECETIPPPVLALDVVMMPPGDSARHVITLAWCRPDGERWLIVSPVCYGGRLRCFVTLTAGGSELWSGWPSAPVPAVRGMLGWVFAAGRVAPDLDPEDWV